MACSALSGWSGSDRSESMLNRRASSSASCASRRALMMMGSSIGHLPFPGCRGPSDDSGWGAGSPEGPGLESQGGSDLRRPEELDAHRCLAVPTARIANLLERHADLA